jgi:hypothetical protein
VGRIDVDVAKAPTSRIELNWTCAYHVCVVSRAWLDEIRDLIDESRIGIGEVRRQGRPLDNWATLHEANAPTLFGTEGWASQCPICGDVYAMIAGRQFFAEPRVVARPLMVSGSHIFVREDLALARNLRTPAGSFKPTVVKFLANPPSIRAEPHRSPGSSSGQSQDERPASRTIWNLAASAVRNWLLGGR